MKKLLLLLHVLVLSGLCLTSCQRHHYTHFQQPSAIPVEHIAQRQTAPVVVEPVATPVTVASVASEQAIVPEMEASTQKVVSKSINNRIVLKETNGVVQFTAKEGKKLRASERFMLKTINKQIAKAEANAATKAKATSKGNAFKDLNKYLRYGLILLAVALILSVLGGAVAYSLWYIAYIAWVAGWILTIYGLGIHLKWW